MHVLVTADTVGGVWTYTRELVTGLASRGIQVTLVSFGGIPTRAQSTWLEELSGVTYFPTGFRLEWMQEAERDIRDSMSYLRGIIHERHPDLLHLSQYCYGALDVALPKVVVAHSDVMSWSQTVSGAEPAGPWAEWYRATVEQGLNGASLLVAPSRWMLDGIEKCYGRQRRSQVVYNGRTPALFNPYVSKQHYAASVGRLWDEGKQSQLLMQLSAPPLPIFLAGATALAGETAEADHVSQARRKTRDRTRGQTRDREGPQGGDARVELQGELSEGEMRELLSRASIYIATSKYEPFGLAPLEAALSRCAIVANDTPSFREVWEDAAFYFRSNDAGALQEALARLQGNRELRLIYANRAYERARQRYTAAGMVEEYMQLYRTLLERRAGAA
jgi:glycosyltransferase involved in cell wall biosynthesis